jgi:hypothetical protein
MDELERILKKAVMALPEVPPQHLPGGNKKPYSKPITITGLWVRI